MPWKRLFPFSALALLLTACMPAGGHVAQASWPGDGPATAAAIVTATPWPTATPTPLPTATATQLPTAMATATPTPCHETTGDVFSIDIPSRTVGYTIDTHVYLPPCYDASTDRYPVLYLIHGLNFTDDQWVRLGAPDAADALLAKGEIGPLIIVMPRDRFDVDFEPLLVDDVVPYVDANYRTVTNRLARAIGGLSRGGGWALHIGLRHPDLFARIGGHSPAVLFDDDGPFVRWVRALPKGLPLAIYLDAGQADSSLNSTLFVDGVFTSAGIDHEIAIRPGAHTEAYWTKWTPDYIRFYAGEWRDLDALIRTTPVEETTDGQR